MTLEEQWVGQLELASRCTQTVVLPPPKACPFSVHAMYGVAQLHLITGLIVVIFLGMLIHLTYQVFHTAEH